MFVCVYNQRFWLHRIDSKLQNFERFVLALGLQKKKSYIAAYVMGIRDRQLNQQKFIFLHIFSVCITGTINFYFLFYDNVLIQPDGTLFHIDFGYALGYFVYVCAHVYCVHLKKNQQYNDKLTIDTSKFAITSDLQQLMGDHWKEFLNISQQAYMILRKHFQELVDYTRLVFAFSYDVGQVEKFLHSQLQMDSDDEDAAKYIYDRLQKAPSKLKTKFKNGLHAIAQFSA
ncbi:phosphatidylinositol 3-kinase catalytic subunit gamma [Reticulomyxa filosa]|uniref:Phosphatidylinositol 3-kinase catalytic subunit gamma n=1 Tax=Reticulomyxa filosa TaxID=46433 RepID=X6NF39_RETFI|nr:phosphatidylinositol 3-kinase catalytic subunit gamma [Reticulomyxa filosa]|eukprot:ETO24915.1 phosphatidylinositol 3-kinase catalytic subunit gamma [Reticulomyxa filosa]